MNIPVVKYNAQDRPEFFQVLRKRVNTHFKENNLSKFANFNMKFKTAFMLCLYFVPFILMLTGVVTTLWPVTLMWLLMGFGMSGIGLSIMHDANHGSYSKNQRVNKALGFLINFIGGYHITWKIQHNVLHHSFTNVDGLDEDIKNKIMRFSPNQERKSIHRFQAFYAPFIYGLMGAYWLLSKDFEQVKRYRDKELLEGEGLTYKQAMRDVAFHKIWYVALTLILPIIVVELPWWQLLLGFLMMQAVCGLSLALIFQPAHVVGETEFYVAEDNEGSMENHWAIHQMHTTANFANGSRLFTWFVGGLNHQIEHHLFPNICHVHYRKISKIVRETAKEFDIPYHSHKTFVGALKSHFTLLHEFGKYRRLQPTVEAK